MKGRVAKGFDWLAPFCFRYCHRLARAGRRRCPVAGTGFILEDSHVVCGDPGFPVYGTRSALGFYRQIGTRKGGGGLVVYHLYCSRLMRDFRNGTAAHSHVFYRWINEIPALLLIAIVLLAVVKPF